MREAWRWAILAAVFGREWLSKRTLCLNGTLEELVNVLLLSWYASSDRQWRERKPRNYAVHEPNNLIIEVYHMLDISVTVCVTGVQISVYIPECITSFYGHHSMIQFPPKKCMLGHARRTSALLSHSRWPQDFPADKCYEHVIELHLIFFPPISLYLIFVSASRPSMLAPFEGRAPDTSKNRARFPFAGIQHLSMPKTSPRFQSMSEHL